MLGPYMRPSWSIPSCKLKLGIVVVECGDMVGFHKQGPLT